jgi:two-component system chemotaxis response regulator CheB
MRRLIRVLVVDDSAFMRKTISTILNQADDIEVIATARNGLDGVQKATDYRPDVITLDIEMPKLNGLDALGYIMSECPTPVVMLSAYTEHGGELTMQALEYGAVDFVCKPSGPISLDLNIVAQELIARVRTAAQVDVTRLKFIEFDKIATKKTSIGSKITDQNVVVIASSTGGPRALYDIVPHLPADLPAAVLIVQHMSAGFTKSLATRMDMVSALHVKEGEDGDIILPGHVYIAPTNYHMSLERHGERILISLNQRPQRNSVRPAADETMEAVAKIYGQQSLGVVLTGMGRDGTQGGLAITRVRHLSAAH